MISLLIGDRLRPVTDGDMRSIQTLHADRGRILVSRDTMPLPRPLRVNLVVRCCRRSRATSDRRSYERHRSGRTVG